MNQDGRSFKAEENHVQRKGGLREPDTLSDLKSDEFNCVKS